MRGTSAATLNATMQATARDQSVMAVSLGMGPNVMHHRFKRVNS